MAATALIKFTQGATVGNDGEVLVGSVGVQVDVANVDNTDVQSWQIDILYTPPGSSIPVTIPLAFSDNGSTPAANFTPDVRGSYRIRLRVWPVTNRTGSFDTDIRNFVILLANGFVLPPYQQDPKPLPTLASGFFGAKPNELNINGTELGWTGDGTDGLLAEQVPTFISSFGGNETALVTGGLVADYANPIATALHGGDVWAVNSAASGSLSGPGITRIDSTATPPRIIERANLSGAGTIFLGLVSTGTKLWVFGKVLGPPVKIFVREVLPGATTTFGPEVVIATDPTQIEGGYVVYDSANVRLWALYLTGVANVATIVPLSATTGAPGTPVVLPLSTGLIPAGLVYDANSANYGDTQPRLWAALALAPTGELRRIGNLSGAAVQDDSVVTPQLPIGIEILGTNPFVIVTSVAFPYTGYIEAYDVNPAAGPVDTFNLPTVTFFAPRFDTVSSKLFVLAAFIDSVTGVQKNQFVAEVGTGGGFPINSTLFVEPQWPVQSAVALYYTAFSVSSGHLWIPSYGFETTASINGAVYRIPPSLLGKLSVKTYGDGWGTAASVSRHVLWRTDGSGDVTTWAEVMAAIDAFPHAPLTIHVDQATTYNIPSDSGPRAIYDMRGASFVAPVGPTADVNVRVQRFATLHNLAGISGGMTLRHGHKVDDQDPPIPVLTFSPLILSGNSTFAVERGARLLNENTGNIPMIDWDRSGETLIVKFDQGGYAQSSSAMFGSTGSLGVLPSGAMALSGLVDAGGSSGVMTRYYEGWQIEVGSTAYSTNEDVFEILTFQSATAVDINSDGARGFAPDPNNGSLDWVFTIPVIRNSAGTLKIVATAGGLVTSSLQQSSWLGAAVGKDVFFLHDGSMAFREDFWTSSNKQLIPTPAFVKNQPLGITGGIGPEDYAPIAQGGGAPSDGTVFVDRDKKSLLVYSWEAGEWLVPEGRLTVEPLSATVSRDNFPFDIDPAGIDHDKWARATTVMIDATAATDITGLEFSTFKNVSAVTSYLPSGARKTLINGSAFNVTLKNLAGGVVAATGTLTFTGNPTAGQKVAFSSATAYPEKELIEYVFVSSITDYAGAVLIGATASDSLDNLIAAINLGAGAGTLYGIGTVANPYVTAVAGAGDTMDVTALSGEGTGGGYGNLINTSTNVTGASWGGATLSGGSGSIPANEFLIAGGDLVIPPDGAATVEYDSAVANKWRVV